MKSYSASLKNAFAAALAATLLTGVARADPREHELKLPIGGEPGPLNAITDVPGVEVGHSTIISGEGLLVPGKGPVRTGVTVVLPRGRENADPVFGGWFTLNGNGEMTGTTWLEEGGFLEGPIGITNTHSVGVVRDAIIAHEVSREGALQPFWLPVVAETYDGVLNDINGFHVRSEHVKAALEGARGGNCTRRQRWRWHRHDVPGLQGRHWHSIAESHPKGRGVYGRRACPVQFWTAARPQDSGRASRGSHFWS